MKELVGKLKRVDVIPCKRVDLEKASKQSEKETIKAMTELFFSELKNTKKLNALLKSQKYYGFLMFIERESKILANKINEKAKSIIDKDILVEIVVDKIQPKLSVKRIDDIKMPQIAPEDFMVSESISQSFREDVNEDGRCFLGTRDGIREKLLEMAEEIKIEKVALKEKVKKVSKITKKED